MPLIKWNLAKQLFDNALKASENERDENEKAYLKCGHDQLQQIETTTKSKSHILFHFIVIYLKL